MDKPKALKSAEDLQNLYDWIERKGWFDVAKNIIITISKKHFAQTGLTLPEGCHNLVHHIGQYAFVFLTMDKLSDYQVINPKGYPEKFKNKVMEGETL